MALVPLFGRWGIWPLDAGLAEPPAGQVPSDDVGGPGKELGIFGFYRLVNEGRSTAALVLPPDCTRVGNRRTEVPTPEEARSLRRNPLPSIHLVEPGEGLLVVAWASRPVDEWREQMQRVPEHREPLRLPLKWGDHYRDGVMDTTNLKLVGVPIGVTGLVRPTTPMDGRGCTLTESCAHTQASALRRLHTLAVNDRPARDKSVNTDGPSPRGIHLGT